MIIIITIMINMIYIYIYIYIEREREGDLIIVNSQNRGGQNRGDLGTEQVACWGTRGLDSEQKITHQKSQKRNSIGESQWKSTGKV